MATTLTDLLRCRASAFTYCLLLLAASVTACKKDSVEPAPEPGPDPVDTTAVKGNFYKLIRVENLAGDTTNSDQPTAAKRDIYFSLEQNQARDPSYKVTSQWDMAFTSIENAAISGNNGADPANLGYRNKAQGGIAIIQKDFSTVTEVPNDLKFVTDKTGIFLDDAGAFGQGVGWALYDFGGNIVGRVPNKEHVCYALGYDLKLSNGTILPARTLIVRTANGNIAKVRMIGIYKNRFNPDEWFTGSPVPYFTFEYVMIPKGETKFKTN